MLWKEETSRTIKHTKYLKENSAGNALVDNDRNLNNMVKFVIKEVTEEKKGTMINWKCI